MPTEPTLRTNLVEGDTGALADFNTVWAWHNAWIFPGATRMYLPSDFTLSATGGVVERIWASKNLK